MLYLNYPLAHHGKPDISSLQSGAVVRPIPCHSHYLSVLAELGSDDVVHESVFVFWGGAGQDAEARPHTVKQVLADLREREGERVREDREGERERTDFKCKV